MQRRSRMRARSRDTVVSSGRLKWSQHFLRLSMRYIFCVRWVHFHTGAGHLQAVVCLTGTKSVPMNAKQKCVCHISVWSADTRRQNISAQMWNFGFCPRVFWNVVLNLRAGWGFTSTDIKLPSASLHELWRTLTALRVTAWVPVWWGSPRVPVSLHSCSHVVYQGSHYCCSAWTSCQAPGYQPGHVPALLPLQRNKLYSLHCRVFSCVSAGKHKRRRDEPFSIHSLLLLFSSFCFLKSFHQLQTIKLLLYKWFLTLSSVLSVRQTLLFRLFSINL